jgi:hypothetical protein
LQKPQTNLVKVYKDRKMGKILNIIILFFFSAFIIAYMTLANLAFFDFLPDKIVKKLPIINNISANIQAKERKIQIGKEYYDKFFEIEQSKKLKVDLINIRDIKSEELVPFLYKTRIIKNSANIEVTEMWIDSVLAIRFFVGIGENTAYTRAVYVTQKINKLIEENTNFDNLLPSIDNKIYKATIKDIEVFRIRPEDAILNNSSQKELLYQWINNIRVALGASLLTQKEL